MKKAVISFLVMTLMLTSISLVNLLSVQAATTDETIATSTDNTIKVSLENIRDIMIENNLDIKIQHKDLEIAKEEYHDALDDYDEDDKPDKTDYYDELGNFDEVAYEDDLATYEKAESTYETKLDAYKTEKTTYYQKVESKVYEAQNAYIQYLENLSDLKLQDDTVKSNEKENQVYKLQYKNGFISKNEYTSLLQDNTTSVNELKELKDAEELARTKLCYTLGINPEENVTFNADITEDFEAISKINYEDDLGKMLENNIEIEDQNDVIDDLDDADDDYDNEDLYDDKVEQANNKFKLLMNDVETEFKGQYNTLMNSYNSIKSSYDSLNLEKNTYSITQTKYDYGFVSQKVVDDAKLTLDTNESALQTKKNEFYVNYLRYLQMKEGY